MRKLALALLAAVAAPSLAAAQTPGKVYRIAGLATGPASCNYESHDIAKGTPWEGQPFSPTGIKLRLALREAGFTDGQNLVIETRCFQDPAQLDGIVADLATRNLDALYTFQIVATQAAKRGLRIPIVFMGHGDPVRYGLAESLVRPGGNVTGVTGQVEELAMKRLQIVRELLPEAKTFAAILARSDDFFPSQSGQPFPGERFGFTPTQRFLVSGWPEVEAALAAMRQQRPDVLNVFSGALHPHNEELLRLATAAGIPTTCHFATQVELGCLVSYSLDFDQVLRQGARMLGKILGGANPAEMPVEQGTKFELVINLKTANALGLAIPPSILQRVDRVIE